MSALRMTLSKPSLGAQSCAVRAKTQLGGTSLRASLPRSQRRAPARLVTVAAVDTASVLEDVRGIIAEQLGTDLEKVTADSKFVDLGADSLDTVEIMMALEEKFDLQLDEEGAEKISTVQQAADLIASQVDSA